MHLWKVKITDDGGNDDYGRRFSTIVVTDKHAYSEVVELVTAGYTRTLGRATPYIETHTIHSIKWLGPLPDKLPGVAD